MHGLNIAGNSFTNAHLLHANETILDMKKKKIKEIRHKGYVGQYSYIQREEYYYGKLIGVKDLVTFEGLTTAETKQAFIEAVNDYIFLLGEVR